MDCFVDYTWKMFFLQQMYFCGKRIRCLVGVYSAPSLEQNYSSVIMVIHNMNSNATLLLTRSHNGFMNMVAIHAFTAIFRQ